MCKSSSGAVDGRIFPLYVEFYLDDMKKVSACAFFAFRYSQLNVDTLNSVEFVIIFIYASITLSFANDLRERLFLRWRRKSLQCIQVNRYTYIVSNTLRQEYC